jgi:hypothetical protein
VSWWLVLLILLLLLLIALAVVALVAVRVFRQGRRLLAEIGDAADRLTAAAEARPAPEAAVAPPIPDHRPSSTRRTP